VAGAVEADWTALEADLVKAFIKAHPQLTGIYCTEAMGVVGSIEALADMNLTGRIGRGSATTRSTAPWPPSAPGPSPPP